VVVLRELAELAVAVVAVVTTVALRLAMAAKKIFGLLRLAELMAPARVAVALQLARQHLLLFQTEVDMVAAVVVKAAQVRRKAPAHRA
jgi:hypothetical protein